MRLFAHYDVHTMDEACSVLNKYKGRAKLNAGGTDLLPALKGDFLADYPEAVINIKTIPGLDSIEEDSNVLKIGALARLSDVVNSPLLKNSCRVLIEAARSIASPQIRNIATMGGNLCQEVRCWYYRYPRSLGGPIQCLRKGGDSCPAVKGDNRYHAIMGGKRCFAVCPSDIALALAALDGQIKVISKKDERSIAVTDFYSPLGNALKKNEMVKEIEIPKSTAPQQQRFLKFTIREPIDFAVASVALVITLKGGVCSKANVALGGIAPTPFRAKMAEELMVGRPLSKSVAEEVAEKALAGAKPISKNAYKIEIVKTLIVRAIVGLTE